MYLPGTRKQVAGRKLNGNETPDARGPHRSGQPRTSDPNDIVKNWNEFHSVGIDVVVTKDDKTKFSTKTRSTAWLVGSIPVVQLEGIAGCYALDRVRAVIV